MLTILRTISFPLGIVCTFMSVCFINWLQICVPLGFQLGPETRGKNDNLSSYSCDLFVYVTSFVLNILSPSKVFGIESKK